MTAVESFAAYRYPPSGGAVATYAHGQTYEEVAERVVADIRFGLSHGSDAEDIASEVLITVYPEGPGEWAEDEVDDALTEAPLWCDCESGHGWHPHGMGTECPPGGKPAPDHIRHVGDGAWLDTETGAIFAPSTDKPLDVFLQVAKDAEVQRLRRERDALGGEADRLRVDYAALLRERDTVIARAQETHAALAEVVGGDWTMPPTMDDLLRTLRLELTTLRRLFEENNP